MVCNIGDKVLVLVNRKGTADIVEGTIVGGTPFGVTVELADGKVVDSRTVRILPWVPETV